VAVAEACDPAPLIRGAEAVYAVTSQGGFEALLHGRPVRTFGMPFYAGWGLTTDDLAPPPRRGTATLEALAHAALADYARYVDPDTGRATSVEATIARLARPKAATQAA
jgi:capsular polysaccharide export protein